jgi:hypothetical protein
MNNFTLRNPMGSGMPKVTMTASLLQMTLPAGGFAVLVPELSPGGGYSAYKRVQ